MIKGVLVIFHLNMSHVSADVSIAVADLAEVDALVLIREAVEEELWPVLSLQGEAVEVPEVGQLPGACGSTGEGQGVPSVHTLGLGVQKDLGLLTALCIVGGKKARHVSFRRVSE